MNKIQVSNYKGATMEPIRIERGFIAEKARGDANTDSATITTAGVDRAGDVIETSGVNYSEYMKSNPVVLFNHGRDFAIGYNPIGKAISINVPSSRRMISTWQWADEIYPEASRIKNMWRDGFLNTTSVGLIVLESEPMEGDKDDYFSFLGPQRVTKSELVEYSIATIPMNPEASRRSMELSYHNIQKAISSGATIVNSKELQENIASFKDLIEKYKLQLEASIKKEVSDSSGADSFVHSCKFGTKEWDEAVAKNSFIIAACKSGTFDERLFNQIYAVEKSFPHHYFDDGVQYASFEPVVKALAIINGHKNSLDLRVDGVYNAFLHLNAHYAEYNGKSIDFEYGLWSKDQTKTFLMDSGISEEKIALILLECGFDVECSVETEDTMESLDFPESILMDAIANIFSKGM